MLGERLDIMSGFDGILPLNHRNRPVAQFLLFLPEARTGSFEADGDEMTDKNSSTSPPAPSRGGAAHDDRLDALDKHIATVRHDQAESAARREAELDQAVQRSFAFSTGFRMSAEVVGGVLFGVLVGLCFDWFLSTSPWGLFAFVLLGFAGGIVNLIRQVKARQAPGNDVR